MNCKKFVVFLISFCTVFFGNVIYTLSCGPTPDPYDYYVSFFSPYTKGSGYEPFYYTALTNFFGDPTPSEETANVADWQNYAGKEVTVKDIRECIYTYPKEQLSAIAEGSTVLPDSVKKNTFAQFLGKEKNREAARYLLFAKSCEPAVTREDPWTAPQRNNVLMEALFKEGQELHDKVRDKDIRDRYSFQLIRLQHYSRQYKEAVASFDQLFGEKEKSSLVYYKALALKAGGLYHLEDSVQSAYLFSRVFEKAPSLRLSCFTSLMWTNASREQVYPLCKDNHEKAMVAAIYGFTNAEPDVTAIRRVYAFDPASPALNILLGREINKLEDAYFSPLLGEGQTDMVGIREGSPGEKSRMLAKLNELQTVTDSLVEKGKLKDVDLWRVSSAYLSYIRKDYPAAAQQLAAVHTKDPEVKDQWEIVNLLVNINQQKTIDSTFEARLLPSLKWFDTKTAGIGNYWNRAWDGSDDKRFAFGKIYRNLLFAILAPRYHRQGDLVKESLIRGRCDLLNMNDFFVSGQTSLDQINNDMKPATLIRLKEFLHQPGKTPYESYLARFLPDNINLDQAIGVSYVRIHDFSNARDWFKKAGDGALEVSYQVFHEQLQDFGEDTAVASYTKPITQLQFCERMLQLQEKMKTTPVPAKVYYDYATALFSISYYGRTWYFVKGYRPSTLWYSPDCDKDAFEKQYFGCYAAESYYVKAAQASTDKEFKARCAFMAARCSQKRTANREERNKYIHAWINNRYFPLLAGSYGETKFYRQAYNQCSYLRDYVKSTRKK